MNADKLSSLRIDPSEKRRPQGGIWMIFILVALILAGAAFLAWPRKEDDRRVVKGSAASKPSSTNSGASQQSSASTPPRTQTQASAAVPGESLLTVSGYIVNRERIEISPRFMGMVKWIGVKKGDAVTNGQVVVLLDDAEYRARVRESEGRLANAKAVVQKAELSYQRTAQLASQTIESKQVEDDARLNVQIAKAGQQEIEGQLELAKTYLDWTVIRSPINGVVLEKLVDPNELVTPQSFGGTRGPSTALIAVADLQDLQVEVDLNEADVAKVYLNQICRISPEAYSDKIYQGYVAEMAPEANRQKGTLQVKVQIKAPDRFLTPELTAKVEFLSEKSPEKPRK